MLQLALGWRYRESTLTPSVEQGHCRHCGLGDLPNEAIAFGIKSRTSCHNTPTPSKLVPLSLTPDHPFGLIASQISFFLMELQVSTRGGRLWHPNCLHKNERTVALSKVTTRTCADHETCG